MDHQKLQALVAETMKNITWPLPQPNLLQFPLQTWPYIQPLFSTPQLFPYSAGPFGNLLANPFFTPQLQINHCSVIRKRQSSGDDKDTELVKKKLSTTGPIFSPPEKQLLHPISNLLPIDSNTDLGKVSVEQKEEAEEKGEEPEDDEIIDIVTIDKIEKKAKKIGVYLDLRTKRYVRFEPRNPLIEPPCPMWFEQEYGGPNVPKHPRAHIYPEGFTTGMIYYLEDDFWKKRIVSLPEGILVPPYEQDYEGKWAAKQKKEAGIPEEETTKETDSKE